MGLARRTVLVTGATGFIGGRLVEKLILEHGAVVRALVRDFRTAVWLSRTSAEMTYGDVTNVESLQRAMQGCSLVFHCAASTSPDYETAYRVNVEGTHNLLEAAKREGVERVVLISSVAVHAPVQDGQVINEEAPFVNDNADAYAQTKLAAEQLAFQFSREHGLPVVVIRPTIVYGPRAPFWTVSYAARISKNRFVLPREIKGENNFIYVDDVVDALIQAAITPTASGEAFIIGAERSTSWVDFLGHYTSMNHVVLPVWPMWLVELLALSFHRIDNWLMAIRRQSSPWKAPLIFGLRALRRVIKPWHRLELWEIRLFQQRQVFSVEKARRFLGYRPRTDLATGMRDTGTWLRCQGYLPAREADGDAWPVG